MKENVATPEKILHLTVSNTASIRVSQPEWAESCAPKRNYDRNFSENCIVVVSGDGDIFKQNSCLLC